MSPTNLMHIPSPTITLLYIIESTRYMHALYNATSICYRIKHEPDVIFHTYKHFTNYNYTNCQTPLSYTTVRHLDRSTNIRPLDHTPNVKPLDPILTARPWIIQQMSDA